MKRKSISIFIPVYNESENIEEAVQRIHDYVKKNFSLYEFIAIDDGSTDDSLEKLKILKDKKFLTKIIQHKKNLGYGATLRDGFIHAQNELIFYTDADNQFNIADLHILLPLIEENDIVSAYRVGRSDPFMRIVTAHVYNLLLKVLFDIPYRDIDASFKLYRKEVISSIDIKANTGLIDAEILIKAKKKNYRIAQIGVSHYPRIKGRTIYEIGERNSKIALVKPRVVWDILKEMRLLWKELH